MAAPLTDVAATSRWFEHRLPQADPGVQGVEVTQVQRVSRGVSRETWLLDALVHGTDGTTKRAGFAVRRDHDVGSVDPVPLRTEYEVYRRLAASPVPVAEPLWYEDDPAWQPDGRDAYVRRQVEGHWYLPFLTSRDPADDEQRIEACKEHLAKLALVHTADWRALGFDEIFPVPDGPDDIVPTLIDLFLARLAEFQIEPSPVLAEGVDWLRATAPEAPCVTLCKGTNGHGEEVWRDGKIVAMSDWELACLAEPAYDLAQTQEMVPTIERDGKTLWGWPDALRHYEAVSGIPVTMERVRYYRRFYALPMFVFTHHAGHQVHVNGNRSARFAWSSTEMQYQAELRFAQAGGFLPELGR
jgi:aminoglycoside phosphotransferase (APT) family kinase protein